MLTFIAGLVSVIGVNGVSQLFKSIASKYGDTAFHVMVFGVCIVVTAVWAIAHAIPSFMNFLEMALALFAAAVALYEAFWKQIGSVVNA